MGSTSVPLIIAIIIAAIVITVLVGLIALRRTKEKPFTSTVWIVNQRLISVLLFLAILAILCLVIFLLSGFRII